MSEGPVLPVLPERPARLYVPQRPGSAQPYVLDRSPPRLAPYLNRRQKRKYGENTSCRDLLNWPKVIAACYGVQSRVVFSQFDGCF